MSDTATKAPANPTAGFRVTRTARDTWHVIHVLTGDHWESPHQAGVLQAVEEYKANAKAREEARLAAEEAARNPSLGEFGTSVPGEPTAFESFVPVSDSGKANLPTIDPNAAGAAPEPTEVQPQQTITLSEEQFNALLAKAGGPSAVPEPEEVQKASRED